MSRPGQNNNQQTTIGLSGLVGHASIYWLGIMASKLLGFVLIPIYTYHLSPAQYGTIELIALTTDVIALIVGVRMTSAVFKFYHATDDEDERQRLLGTALATIIGAALVFLVIALPFAGEGSQLLFGSRENTILLRLVFVTTALQLVQEIALTYRRIHERSGIYISVMLSHLCLIIGFNLLFIVGLGYGVFGAILSGTLASALVAPVVIVSVIRHTGLALDRVLLRRMVQYSLPLIPAALGLFVLHFGDRYLLNVFVSLEAVGLYALGYKFGFLISQVIAQPFSLIWGNRMHILYRDQARDRLYNQVLSGYAVVLAAAALALSLFIDEVLMIVSPAEYQAAANLVPFIAGAYVLGALNQLSMGPLYAEGRTGAVAVATLSAAGANVLLNLALIPLFGAIGAAVATVLAFFTLAGVTQWLATRWSSMRWDYRRAAMPMAVGLALIVFGRSVEFDHLLWGIAFKLLLLALYPLLLLATRAVPTADLAELRDRLRRRHATVL